MDNFFDERFGLFAEREFDAARRAEEICDDRITAALHALEEKRGAALRDDATMNFRQFQIGINLCFNDDEIAFACELIASRG
jgi:hypothetical protein